MRRFGAGLAFQALSALSLTDPVKKILDKIFWNWIFQIISPFTPIIEDYAFPTAFFCFGLYIWTREGYGASLLQKVKRWVNVYYFVASVAALIFIGALVGAWLDYMRGPINWVLDSPGSPIFFSQMPGQPVVVSGFNVIGHNRADDPVPLGESSLRSDITNQVLHFKISIPGGYISTKDATVEPDGAINLQGDYPDPKAQTTGITIDQFRSEFGRFTFSINYGDGRSFKKSFSENDVDDLIDKAAKEQMRLHAHTPGVVRNRN